MPGPNIAVAISNLEAKLAEATANPQPDYEVNGKKVSWSKAMESWTKMLESLYRISNQATPYIQRTLKRM